MKLLSHYWSYLRSCGSLLKFALTGKEELQLTFLTWGKGKTWVISQSRLCVQKDHGADLHGKQGGDW